MKETDLRDGDLCQDGDGDIWFVTRNEADGNTRALINPAGVMCSPQEVIVQWPPLTLLHREILSTADLDGPHSSH